MRKKAMPRPAQSPSVKIRELTPAEMPQLFPLIKQLNPDINRAEFARFLKEAIQGGYRCLGAFQGKKLVGACGIWIMSRFWCGRFLEVDNLVVDQHQRNDGIGKLLMQKVERLAHAEKCRVVLAASYSYNHASHRFYLREKYIIKGFVFYKELQKP